MKTKHSHIHKTDILINTSLTVKNSYLHIADICNITDSGGANLV